MEEQHSLDRLKELYAKYRTHTMIWEPHYWDNLALASKHHIPGSAILECGVWKGGMIAGMADILDDANASYHLFDSFEGLPPVAEIDGPAAKAWQEDSNSEGFYDNCRAGPEEAKEAMELSSARSFYLHPGWFEETFPKAKLDRGISILRLDADWYEATFQCLDRWFDEVLPGGVVILDDYLTWDGCSRAVHDFLSSRSLAEKIKCTHWEVPYFIKL